MISNDIFYDRQINKLPLAASITSNYRSFRYPIIYRDTIDYAILFIDTSTSQAHFLIGAPYFAIIASNIVHASHFQYELIWFLLYRNKAIIFISSILAIGSILTTVCMAIYFSERGRKYRDQGQQQATSNAEREQGVSERHNTPGGTFYKAVRFGQANVPL